MLNRSRLTVTPVNATTSLFRSPHPVLNSPTFDEGLRYTLEGTPIRTFSGRQAESITAWTREIHVHLAIKKLTPVPAETAATKAKRIAQQHQYILDLLEGEARDWYIERAQSDPDFMNLEWGEANTGLRALIEDKFASKDKAEKKCYFLSWEPQAEDESIDDFYERKRTTAVKYGITKEEMKYAFYAGLLEKYRLDMTIWDSRDFEEVLNKLRTREGMNVQNTLLKAKEEVVAKSTRTRKICTYCGKAGHEESVCYSRSRDLISPSPRGGIARSPMITTTSTPVQAATASLSTPLTPTAYGQQQRTPASPLVCFRCHLAGHYARDCPNIPKNA